MKSLIFGTPFFKRFLFLLVSLLLLLCFQNCGAPYRSAPTDSNLENSELQNENGEIDTPSDSNGDLIVEEDNTKNEDSPSTPIDDENPDSPEEVTPPVSPEEEIPPQPPRETDQNLPTSKEFAAQYEVYYVDNKNPSSSDNNNGSKANPWKTIQKAANVLKPGEMVYVNEGIYSPFEVNVEGSEDFGDVVFSVAPGHEGKVIVDGNGGGPRGLILIKSKSYIQIHGFKVQNASTDGIFIEGSPGGERSIRIVGNTVYHTGNSGIYAAGLIMGSTIGVEEYRLFDLTIENNDVSRTNEPSGGNEAITIGGGLDGFIVRNNYVHDSEQYGIDCKLGCRNGEIYGNHIHDLEKHGIYIDSASRTAENINIYSNRIYRSSNGITLARESAREPKVPQFRNVNIYNNLVYENQRYGIMAYKHIKDTLTGDFKNVRIFHNTIVGNGRDGIHLPKAAASVIKDFYVANNILYQNTLNFRNEVGAKSLSNLIGVNPQFKDAKTKDFYLTNNSPALNRADPNHTVDFDFYDQKRPLSGLPDIGAVEAP